MTKNAPTYQAWITLVAVFACGIFLFSSPSTSSAAVNGAFVVTLTATPSSSSPGAPVTLQWSATLDNGEIPTCTGTGFSTDGARNGSVTVNPNVTTTYSIDCDSTVRTATVTISSNPPTASLSANPTSVLYGGATTLSWSSTNATSCTDITDFDNGGVVSTGGATSGSVTTVPGKASNRYSLSCSGSGGAVTSNTVTVTAQQPPSIYLAVSPTTIQTGNSASLTWSVTNATSCTGTNFSTGGAMSGTVSVSPSQNTTYTLTCQGNVGSSATQSVVLGVNQPPIGISCSVNPSPARINQSVTWFASAWGGTSPYSFSWIGDLITGLTGSSVSATYDSAGSKNATVQATDSSPGSGKWNSTGYDNQICTGPVIASDGDTEDGGTVSNMTAFAKAWARSKVYDSTFGPADFHVNPQNYCVQAHVGQACNPANTTFGPGNCPYGVDAELHSGSGQRAAVSSDYRTANGWTSDKYWGTVIFDGTKQAGGSTASYNCPVLTVNADAPTATLAANPISITQGQGSTLTWSSTNSTSCTGTNFSTGGATSGTASVSPNTGTTYIVTCIGSGGSSSATAWVAGETTNEEVCHGANSPALVFCGNTSATGCTAGDVCYKGSKPNGWGCDTLPANSGPTYDTVTQYTCTYSSNPQSATAYANVSVTALQADLTAGSISPASATAGIAVTLSAPITNIGNGSTGAGFTDLFQRASDNSGTGAVDIGTYTSAALAASAGNTASLSYTFPSAATWYVRACADKSSAGSAGVISESDENNNCGAWTAVSVAAATVPSLSCSPNASSVNTGQTVTYTVTPAGGATGPYSWTDSDGWTGSGSSVSRTYATGGTYAMSVAGANVGTTYCSPQVSVTPTTCSGTPTVNITATPNRVRAGQTSTISWSATNVPGASPSCTVTGPGVSQNPAAGSPPSCSIPNGSATPVINTQSTYTITCASVSKSVTVNVLPKILEF